MADIEGAITLDVAFRILGRRQSGPGALLLSREASLVVYSRIPHRPHSGKTTQASWFGH